MELASIKRFFPEHRHADIDRAYSEFQRRRHTDDVERFLTFLWEKELITSAIMRDLVTLGDVTLGAFDGADDFLYEQEQGAKHKTLGVLGKGAMGEVLIARERDLNRTVAVKRIKPERAGNNKLTRRFFAEAQITAQLDHPSIVPVYSLDVDDTGAMSYAMKLVRGETLKHYIAEARRQHSAGGTVSEDHGLADRLELFLAACDAIAYAHSRGVIHRDLKPDNIMVGAFHEVVVMDWGIARLIGTDDEPINDLEADDSRVVQTQAGRLVGTPPYMSPEQARGLNDQLTGASDQYALGLILFELATLKRAVTGDGAMKMVLRAAEADKDPLTFFNNTQRVPRELRAIIDKATSLKVEDRYAGVSELADDVRRFQQNESVEAAPDKLHHRLQRWISVHRAKALAIGFGLLTAIFAVGAGVFLNGVAKVESERAAAAVREDKLADIVDGVTAQVQTIDGAFAQYESALAGMVYAAEYALNRADAPQRRPVACATFNDPKHQPADTAQSPVYKKPISTRELCLEVAPGVSLEALGDLPPRLASLGQAFRQARLQSEGPETTAEPLETIEKLLRVVGLPAVFTYMGTPQGVMATYPARATNRNDYDPRKRPWYADASKRHGPGWLAVDSASDRKGLLLTVAQSVRGADGELDAVAAIDIEFSYLIEAFLEPPEGVAEGSEVYLLNRAGVVVVQSEMRDIAETVNDYTPPPFPYKDLIGRFAKTATGHAIAGSGDDTRLLVWSTIKTPDWTYIVASPPLD